MALATAMVTTAPHGDTRNIPVGEEGAAVAKAIEAKAKAADVDVVADVDEEITSIGKRGTAPSAPRSQASQRA
jgi:hypothetical protein